MAATATATYDLVLLLDTGADDKSRAAIVDDVSRAISANGELVRHDRWGNRELAYPIRHKEQAEYHLLQFHPADTQLLKSLDRSLRINDDVLRFRIVKLRPGTPAPPSTLRGGEATAAGEGAAREAGAAAATTATAAAPAADPATPATPGTGEEDAAAGGEPSVASDASAGGEGDAGDAPAGGEGAGDAPAQG